MLSPPDVLRTTPYPAVLGGLIVALVGALTSGCATNLADPGELRQRASKAKAMFAERCKSAGEKIYHTAADVDGIVLLKLRPKPINFDNQFVWDDPYGNDLFGDGYIESFLRGSFQANHQNIHQDGREPIGYQFVDVLDATNGFRLRYTGQAVEPWLSDKSYLKGYIKFVIKHEVTEAAPPRYGLTYDDISTQEEREYWIAGSSLRIVDLVTNEVVAERIGYMMDPLQGSRSHGRSPWLLAADHACPKFPVSRGTTWQLGQAENFVEKVLVPRQ